ncbi:MAG TPA: helix-turn-helix domain-containing protein [Candidatus Sulfotelmatobacter sp.]|nr:helix-turn-helix domain-containing protein [Candidatus Sulfotelmatobacter sp.]
MGSSANSTSLKSLCWEEYMQSVAHSASLRSIACSLQEVFGSYSVEATGCKEPKLSINVRHASQYTIIDTELTAVHLRHSRDALMKGWKGHAFLVWQQSGQIEVNEGGYRYFTHKDSLVLIDPSIENSLRTDGSARVLSMTVPNDQLATIRQEKTLMFGSPVDGSSGLGRVVAHIFCDLISTESRLSDREMDVATSSMINLLGHAFQENRTKSINPPVLLQKMAAWVVEHVSDPTVSPCKLAETFNLSRRSLYRLFAANGLKPDAWLWSLRVEEAGKQLRGFGGRDSSITDIAFRTGFNDISHFIRLFSQTFGTTPSRYRRQFWMEGNEIDQS